MRFDVRRGRTGDKGIIDESPLENSGENRLLEDKDWTIPELLDEIGHKGSELERGLLTRKLSELRKMKLNIMPEGFMSVRVYCPNVDVAAELINTAEYTGKPTYGLGVEIPGVKEVYIVIPDMTKTSISELTDITKGIVFGYLNKMTRAKSEC